MITYGIPSGGMNALAEIMFDRAEATVQTRGEQLSMLGELMDRLTAPDEDDRLQT